MKDDNCNKKNIRTNTEFNAQDGDKKSSKVMTFCNIAMLSNTFLIH